MQGIVGIRGVCESVQPEFNSLAKEDGDHLGAEAHNADGGLFVRGAVWSAQLAALHIVAPEAGGGPADQTLSEFLGVPLRQENNGVSPPNALVHRHLNHGIAEDPKEVFAGGVILPELAFSSRYHGPIKGGNTGIGVGAEGG